MLHLFTHLGTAINSKNKTSLQPLFLNKNVQSLHLQNPSQSQQMARPGKMPQPHDPKRCINPMHTPKLALFCFGKQDRA